MMGFGCLERAARAMPLAALAVVVACGRIGFDFQPEVDSGLGTLHPDDASASFDSRGTDGPQPNLDGPLTSDVQPDGDLGDATPGDALAGDETAPDGAQSSCTPTCANAHGTTACINGACAPVCAAGYADCDGKAVNGCETNVNGDPAHCGSCMGACVVDSGSPVCRSAVCGTSSCAPGSGHCDGNPASVCETDLNTSTANCSFCGNACTNANGSTSCAGGVCKPSCSAGFGDCDGDPTNGCEAKLDTVSNCGVCGKVCTSDAGTPVCNGSTCATNCDLSGPWAAKVTVPLTWPGTSAIASGSGAFVMWAILNGAQSGNSIPATLRPCGMTVADDMGTPAAGSELYGVIFPNALFDHMPAYLPATATTVTLGGSVPGSTFSVPTLAFLVGLTMTNPTSDPWPPSPQSVMQVDMDQDTKPAVTTPYKSGGSYSQAAVDPGKSARADKAYLALRVVASFAASVTNCANVSGSATVADFHAHIVGCELAAGGDCSMAQSNFVDSNIPAFVTGSATISLVKVAASATCAVVRAAL